MNKEFERYLILFLLLMLIGLSGCTEKEMTPTNNPKLPDAVSDKESSAVTVSYTHLTLPTKA